MDCSIEMLLVQGYTEGINFLVHLLKHGLVFLFLLLLGSNLLFLFLLLLLFSFSLGLFFSSFLLFGGFLFGSSFLFSFFLCLLFGFFLSFLFCLDLCFLFSFSLEFGSNLLLVLGLGERCSFSNWLFNLWWWIGFLVFDSLFGFHLLLDLEHLKLSLGLSSLKLVLSLHSGQVGFSSGFLGSSSFGLLNSLGGKEFLLFLLGFEFLSSLFFLELL